MTFENLNSEQESRAKLDLTESRPLSDSEMTGIKVNIQRSLMQMEGIDVDNDEAGVVDWINLYAKDFSEYLQEHQSIANEWKMKEGESSDELELRRNTLLNELIQAEKDGFPHKEIH
jgi:hypothetical protein